MSTQTRYRGDDIDIDIIVTDENDDAVNIENLAELYIYITHNNSVLIQFNKAGTGGFTALKKITSYLYLAIIKSGTTKSAELGNYNIDGNVIETDADYESSEKNTITIEDLFSLKDSKSKAVSSG